MEIEQRTHNKTRETEKIEDEDKSHSTSWNID